VDALFALVPPQADTSIERFVVKLETSGLRQKIVEASLEAGAPLLEMRPFTPPPLLAAARY